jgi:hypothetical protein
MLVQANMTEHAPHFVTSYFHGPLYDYYPMWYKRVGSIIVTNQWINSWLPYMNPVLAWAVPTIK